MRRVLHWDGDGYFASIEQAADRRLRGRPLAVGGVRRGVVLSASAEAKRYGIRTGMPMPKARRMCPPLTVVPAHFDLYERFGEQIAMLCEEKTPLVEDAASGAGWLDLTGTEKLNGMPLEVASELRRTTMDWLRVPLSFALATNKTVARVAARVEKPHGPVEVPAGRERQFLAPLGLRWLPGMQGEHVDTLHVAGVRRIGELAQAPLDGLELILGKRALQWQRRAQGVDETPVGGVKKRVEPVWREGVEFAEDVWETDRILREARALLDEVMPRVREENLAVRRLTLGLRYTDREENERSVTLEEPASVEAEFYPKLPGLLRDVWDRRVRLRALWVRVGRVYAPDPQMSLFGPGLDAQRREKEEKLAAAMDRLKSAFGKGALRRGLGPLVANGVATGS